MNRKKIERFKLYNFCKHNGKVCLINKYNKLAFQIGYNESLHLSTIYLQNYKELVDSLFYNTKVRELIEKEMHNEVVRFNRCKKRLDKMFLKSDNLFFIHLYRLLLAVVFL